MHKSLIISAALLLCTLVTNAQYRNSDCPKLYLGFSAGINNAPGFIGLNIDVPVTQQFSLGTGGGLSTWGYKAYGEGRFYFNECNRGWALGTGLTYSTGAQNLSLPMPTTIGETDVTLDLEPTMNIMFSGYRFFNLGRSGHRFHLQLGYSYALDDAPYTVKSNHVITSDGKAALDLLSPSGIIIGFGFTFGIFR